MSADNAINTYEVLSPWAEADPIPWKGINKRLADLAGKKVGYFWNSKRAGRPMLSVIEEKLKTRFPACESDYFPFMPNEGIADTEYLPQYEEWLKGVDAVVFSYGD